MATMSKQAKNFPKITCRSVTSLVSSNSMVPVFFSSANWRMVSAGMKKKSVQKAMLKNTSKSACLRKKISAPLSQVKMPVNAKKAISKI